MCNVFVSLILNLGLFYKHLTPRNYMNIPKSKDFSVEKHIQFAIKENNQKTTFNIADKDINWKKAREVMREQTKTINLLKAQIFSMEENLKKITREALEEFLKIGDPKFRLEFTKILLEVK